MKIVIACDPNAMEFKDQLRQFIVGLGHECEDYGSEDPIYANTAFRVAQDVADGKFERGILLCGTGIGMGIAANKVQGAYAATVSNVYQAQRAQLSNNANILTMGAQVIGIELAKCLVKEYLACAYDPRSRSGPKVERILNYEKGQK
jgi:ribose 5-phosphate isomerase B